MYSVCIPCVSHSNETQLINRNDEKCRIQLNEWGSVASMAGDKQGMRAGDRVSHSPYIACALTRRLFFRGKNKRCLWDYLLWCRNLCSIFGSGAFFDCIDSVEPCVRPRVVVAVRWCLRTCLMRMVQILLSIGRRASEHRYFFCIERQRKKRRKTNSDAIHCWNEKYWETIHFP